AVVPSYRDVAAAVSDAERYRNEAIGDAESRRWLAEGEAQETRDRARSTSIALKRRASGERDAFVARASARDGRPDLTDFRLLWDAMAASYAGRPKLILAPRAPGRRQVWMADPRRFGLVPTAAEAAPDEPAYEPI